MERNKHNANAARLPPDQACNADPARARHDGEGGEGEAANAARAFQEEEANALPSQHNPSRLPTLTQQSMNIHLRQQDEALNANPALACHVVGIAGERGEGGGREGKCVGAGVGAGVGTGVGAGVGGEGGGDGAFQVAGEDGGEGTRDDADAFKSSKLNLKREVKFGRRGGACWPLWVTEVCCELLVNGSPPSAIPSSIGTLTATLYGEEPKKLPSFNFVRQCRVLVQIIGETITAMKLAACPNWAEIFFDSTTCRQVPFTAVVISLMGDGPDSLDSIIVSSCIVLEDETSEKQVDRIVNKVSWQSSWFICIAYFDMANTLQRLILSETG